MTLKGDNEKYGKLARIIHWLTMILVTIIIPLGLYLANAEYTDAINIFRVHIIFGILVFILTIIRIVWSILDTRPDYPEDIVGIQLIAYRVNHYLLYILLFILGSSGLTMLFGSNLIDYLRGEIAIADYQDILPAVVHRLMGFALIAFYAMHVFGVMRHHIFESDVLSRLGVKFPRKQ